MQKEEAFAVADFDRRGVFRQSPRSGDDGGSAEAAVGREVFPCGPFAFEVFEGDGSFEGPRRETFEIISCASGSATIEIGDGRIDLAVGRTALLPKGKAPLKLSLRGAILIRAYPTV